MQKFTKALIKDNRGGALILAAVALPMLIGGAGLAVDTVSWALAKRHLQRSADTAAMAGAMARVQDADVEQAVLAALELNFDVQLSAPPLLSLIHI